MYHRDLRRSAGARHESQSWPRTIVLIPPLRIIEDDSALSANRKRAVQRYAEVARHSLFPTSAMMYLLRTDPDFDHRRCDDTFEQRGSVAGTLIARAAKRAPLANKAIASLNEN